MDNGILNKNRSFKQRHKIVSAIILSLLALLQLFPFWIQIVSSLQPLDFLPESGKIYLLPSAFSIGNYREAIVRVELVRGVVNSLVAATGYTLLSGVMILIVGYVVGKKRFKGRGVVKFMLLLTMMVPGEILMVTNYLLVSDLNWTNSFAGLILPGIVNVTGIYLVMSFMNTIPDSVLEAAYIDGAGELTKIFRIVLPLAMPVLSTYAILTFIAQWNDYLWPMIVTGDSRMFTVQLKLKEFNPYYGGFADEYLKSAAYTLSILPVLIVYIFCQKQLIGGMSISGLK
jgi:multiple sugar transport system permease protein